MSAATARRTRLLLGAGSFSDAESALKLVELLGERMAADLRGLFIEAPVGALTSRHVISMTGQLIETPTAEDAARATNRDARAFRRRLSLLAQSRTVEWSFEQRSGDVATCLCETAQDWDIALMGSGPLHHAPGRVVCIAPASAQAQELAQALAGVLGVDLLSLSLSQDEGDERFTSQTGLLARLNRLNAAALVADWGMPPLSNEKDLRDLITAARCPVLLLGSRKV